MLLSGEYGAVLDIAFVDEAEVIKAQDLEEVRTWQHVLI
jgi:hypothetical protein